jgi:hypothetical protein
MKMKLSYIPSPITHFLPFSRRGEIIIRFFYLKRFNQKPRVSIKEKKEEQMKLKAITRITFILSVIALGFGIMACGGGGTPADGNGNGGNGDGNGGTPTTLDATLNGGQEVPPVLTAATGTGTVTINAAQDQISFTLDVTGPFSSGDITQAHIHNGAAGVNGAISIWLCTDLGNLPATLPAVPLCADFLPTLQLTGTRTAADLDPGGIYGTFASLVAGLIAGNTYMNVHTVANPGGEIRGQIGVEVTPAVVPQNDSFNFIGNTVMTVPAVAGVLANDPAGSVITAVDTTLTNGNVALNTADGSFVYTPVFQFTGPDTFTYTVSGAAGPTTVTIQIDSLAWYVNNTAAAGGTGSQTFPFNTLVAAQTASGPGDTIFVFAGDGTSAGQNAGISLQADERLLGQGTAFTFTISAGNTVTIVPAGTAPVIQDTLGITNGIVNLASNNEVAGVNLTGDGVTNNAGISGTGIAGFNIHDVSILNSTQQGITLINASGLGFIMNNTISNNDVNQGIEFLSAAPALLTVSGNTLTNIADTGIRVQYNAGSSGGSVAISSNAVTNVGVVGNDSPGIDLETNAAILTSLVNLNTVDTAGRAGIAVQSNLAGTHSSIISGNTINNTSNADATRGGLNLDANDAGSTLNASIQNNTLTLNSAGNGVDISTGAGVGNSVCIDFLGNNSDTGFELDNTSATALQVEGSQVALEAGNTGAFIYNPNVGAISFVAVGTCLF